MRLKKCMVGIMIATLITGGMESGAIYNNENVKAASTNSLDTEPLYWRMEESGEPQTINLLTDNVPKTETYAGVRNNTTTRTNNTADIENQVWPAKYKELDNTTFTDKSYTSVSGVYMDYEILYDGEAILVPVNAVRSYDGRLTPTHQEYKANTKLEYAIEETKVTENSINWLLAEEIVTVPIKAEYTYTRWNETTPAMVNYLNFSGSAMAPAASAFPNMTDKYTQAKDYWGAYPDLLYRYVDTPRTYLKAEWPIYKTEETITYTDTMDFYVIDTTTIEQNEKDVNVYLKSLQNKKVTTVKYRFHNKRKSDLKVTYKKQDGFKVTGLCHGYKWKGWVNNLTEVGDRYYGDQVLLWKTQNMTKWNAITPRDINESIPIEQYSQSGATLYFMDANLSSSIVTLKIPVQPNASNTKLKVKNLCYELSSFKAEKEQIRVYTADQSGSVQYKAVPSEIATLDKDNWYDFKGTEEMKNKIDIMKLFGLTDNKNTHRIPGFYIEKRVKETDKKFASGVKTLYVNEQELFHISDTGVIELSEGIIKISDAISEVKYEYAFKDSDLTKWKKVSKSFLKDKALVAGQTICLRKQSVKASDGTVLLPSTYIELKVPETGNVLKVTKNDIDDMLS